MMESEATINSKKTKLMKPMVWSFEYDQMLTREILVVEPFTGSKKGTVARGAKWEEVAENLNKIQQIYFKVGKRAVRDRYNNLAKDVRAKNRREQAASGIETNMTDVEIAIEEIIEKEDAAEKEQKGGTEQKKLKDIQDRGNAEDIRKKAMETFAQTQKRKAAEGGDEGKKKKKRSSGNDTFNYLRERNGQIQDLKKEELDVKRKQIEVEAKRHDDLMKVMLNQQQQQQRQMIEFQNTLAVQTKQQNDLLLGLFSKLVNK